MKPVYIFLIFSLIFFQNCSTTTPINNIETPPKVVESDKQFANVFKILDGNWNGNFLIYEDQNLRPAKEVELQKLTIEHIKSNSLKLVNQIDVQQVYTSESPYFQRVTITDTYPESGKKEVAKGVNKVQDGKMWCVVHKPSETIIHSGSTEGKSTIIWQQKQTSPQRVEYFYETVSEQFYEIIGYGYYAGDDPSLSPKLWFYGKYERQ